MKLIFVIQIHTMLHKMRRDFLVCSEGLQPWLNIIPLINSQPKWQVSCILVVLMQPAAILTQAMFGPGFDHPWSKVCEHLMWSFPKLLPKVGSCLECLCMLWHYDFPFCIMTLNLERTSTYCMGVTGHVSLNILAKYSGKMSKCEGFSKTTTQIRADC